MATSRSSIDKKIPPNWMRYLGADLVIPAKAGIEIRVNFSTLDARFRGHDRSGYDYGRLDFRPTVLLRSDQLHAAAF
jgi:hypothetical protein